MPVTDTTTPDVVLTGLAPTGNRCDHDPKNPRLELDWRPGRKGKLPAVLQRCIDNLQAYYFDRSILRPLAELDASDKKVTAGKRSNRSEAREAEVLVISAILECLDLTSMLVGVPMKGGTFVHRSTYEFAKMAGLLDPVTDEPHKRFTRCLSRLRRSGFMETTQQRRKDKDGNVRACVGIKKVSTDFIVMLMGGTAKDAARLDRARESHYKATKERRGRGAAPTPQEERDAMAERMIAKAKANEEYKAAKKAAKLAGEQAPAIDMFCPDAHAKAYQKARSAHQKQLLDRGADFQQINQAMRAFPTIENWQPLMSA
ncbi:MAG: hypothetical protein ACRCXB_15290 [Aeromonadaceae bacterium]